MPPSTKKGGTGVAQVTTTTTTAAATTANTTKRGSSSQSIKILVCTANLGNAKPDASSWDAWIPKEGRIPSPSTEVRMTLPERRKPRRSSSADQDIGKEFRTRHVSPNTGSIPSTLSKNNSNTNSTTTTTTKSTLSAIPSTSKQRKQRSSQDATAFSLQRKTTTTTKSDDNASSAASSPMKRRNRSDPNVLLASFPTTTATTRKDNNDDHVDSVGIDDYEQWLQKQKLKQPKQLQPTETAGSIDDTEDDDDDFNWVPPPPTPTGNHKPSISISSLKQRPSTSDDDDDDDDDSDSYERFLHHLQTQSMEEEDEEKDEVEDGTSDTEQQEKGHGNPNIGDDADLVNAIARQKQEQEEAPGEERMSLTPPKRIDSTLRPQPPSTLQPEQQEQQPKQPTPDPVLPMRGRRDGSHDTKRPKSSSSKSKSKSRSPTPQQNDQTTTIQDEYFDLIVIGMQEATFEPTKTSSKTSKKSKKQSDSKTSATNPKSTTLLKKKKKKNVSKNDNSNNNNNNNVVFNLPSNDPSNSKKNKNSNRLSSTSSQYSTSTGGDDDWDDDDDDSLSSSDDEEMCILHDDGTVTIVDDYTKLVPLDNEEPTPEKGKTNTTSKGLKKLLAKGTTTTAKTIVKVGYKAGKQAGKAGYLVSKKVSKAADVANRYAGSGKDHTLRQMPSAIRVSSNATALDDKNAGGWTDTDTIHYRLEAEQIPGYRRALSYQFGEMRLLVYVRLYSVGGKKPTIRTIDIESVKYQATGIGGVLANKGGIVAEVLINHNTRLSFLSAHLEAHEGEAHFNARCTSFQDILMGAGHKYYDATQSSHYSFAMGDLNFRTRLVGVSAERHLQTTHKMAANKDWRILNQYDELRMALVTKKCLVGYDTPYCNFAPTFKVARHKGYQYNIKRSPSYTDRILFKSTDQLDDLVPFLYEGVDNFVSSDHKPIRGAFEIPLNPSLKWKPAAPDKKARGTKVKLTAQRETMHFFVSDIRCTINPNEYDRLKRTEKADTPNPVLLFVTNPNSAIIKDDISSKKNIWNKLGLNSIKKAAADTPTDSSSKYPSTSILKDTMRPDWGKESVHFTVSTHKSSGEPVFLSASMLHFCLRDSKQAFLIGSYALNLAKLIAITRNNGPSTPNSNGAGDGRRGSVKTSNRRGSTGGFNLAAPSKALLSAGVTGSSNEHVQRASLTLNPNQGKNNANSLLPTNAIGAKSFQQTLSRTGSVRYMGRGPSNSLIEAMMEDGNASTENQGREKFKGLNLMSLRLENEPLIGGGLEVANIKCSIDVWWTQDDE
ncbi:hypothetical protein IV203_019011 [Nitzschia inconspicua]|uniref:Inositol polyphosphate-related phosphatase domain-containing protein n=1 Tax=Nitzschia inconspicua TaxID=303405 RepID=A0A9K3M1B2_9STRA|nr:hypothetical protein IV203_022670 [Nitzschia inconspicua]KAG7370441.1 hypothetical protein IV203_019011 [Nitzschia inconspicua]